MNQKYVNLILLIILAVILFFSPLILNFGKTGSKTSILNIDYSNLSKKEIIEKLDKDFSIPEKISLRYSKRIYSLYSNSISLSLSKNQIASNLLFRRLNKGLANYITAYFKPKNFTLVYQYDQNLFKQQLEKIEKEINKPFVPSEMYLDKFGKIKIKDGEIGKKVDIKLLEMNILNALNNYKIKTQLEIPVSDLGTLPTKDQIDSAILQGQKIVGKNLSLIAPDQKILIDDKTLISWLDINNSCWIERINDYSQSLIDSLKKDPIDAVFNFSDNKVVEFKPSTKGHSLDAEKLPELICRKITDILASNEKTFSIDLPLIFSDPKIDNEDVNSFGIKELIGKGTSSFKHSSAARNYNVKNGSSIVNHILVKPGDTLSFVTALGKIEFSTGFGNAYVIKEGRTQLDVGGGICQVSTTLFRAALNAGLDIIERHAHAYRVGYYEEDMPPGYDATVFSPSPDLKFKNDTGHYILIQSTYDGVKKTLEYNIYGTYDGRKVEITNYRQWGAAPPPPDIYNDDPALPSGKIVQDEHKVGGLKTAFDWKVTRNGEILHEQTFSSIYRPWAAVYRRGTGQ